MSKLTLSVDGAVVNRAKRYAKQQGTSVSKMVETYLSSVAEGGGPVRKDTPILKSLRGILQKADVKDYKRYLENKYR
jgi:Family of unknown function (DUF6364)